MGFCESLRVWLHVRLSAEGVVEQNHGKFPLRLSPLNSVHPLCHHLNDYKKYYNASALHILIGTCYMWENTKLIFWNTAVITMIINQL